MTKKKEVKKDRRLRIMWSSNAVFANSGYSVQTRDILYRLIADGWQVAHTAFYGLEGGVIELNGLRIYPKMGELWGTDACYHHARDFGAHVTFTMQNVWPMDINILPKLTYWIPYTPIEHDPLEPSMIVRLKLAKKIITFSKFGQKILENAGMTGKLILEAVDTNLFQPQDKLKARARFALPPDIFMFGMVAANKDNPPRKAFQEVMDAFKIFVEKHPKSGIFFQTLLQQQGGFAIEDYAKFLGIEKHIFALNPYDMIIKSNSAVIATLMNAFDCLLSPSLNEGFGLPIVEAQACGVPAIVNNFSSMPELVIPGKTGFITDVAFKRWTPTQSYCAHPSTQSIYEKMEEAYRMDKKETAKACRKHAVDNYDMDKRVKEEWIPYLENLQTELLGPSKEEVKKDA